MYGGIEDTVVGGKITPTGDVYSMKLHLSKFYNSILVCVRKHARSWFKSVSNFIQVWTRQINFYEIRLTEQNRFIFKFEPRNPAVEFKFS